jgi:D-beta-D-heptose 7-phosphate kinase/D-beta-D-heptose 1-phosphate adenosyltransferase
MKRVMVNGTFDILHRGHIELLNFAKRQGNYLLVAIDTDRRVKELKGHTRPVNNQDDRKFHLINLEAVNEVQFFDSKEELIEIMKEYQPDVYVKGSDWQGQSSTAEKYAKQLIFFPRIVNYSTTNTIAEIQKHQSR